MADRPRVILVINDLIFETKVRASAQAADVDLVVVRGPGDLARQLDESSTNCVIIDLNTAEDFSQIIRTTVERCPHTKVIAFGSHVDVDSAKAARAAGAHEVLPRSRFVAELERILTSGGDQT